MQQTAQQLRVGATAPPFFAETLAHGRVEVPPPQLLHLQFRRFSGCPICNLHLRKYSARHSELEAAGVTSLVVFHSSLADLAPYHAALPFPVIADPNKHLYRLYGVQSSLRALLHPQAAWAMAQGLARPAVHPLQGANDPHGLPANFLVAPSGTIRSLHYGAHADDQWSIDELLQLVRVALAEP